jgi:hypothetical protein
MLRRVQPNPHTNWMLSLRDVRIKVKRTLPSSFLVLTTTKKESTQTNQNLLPIQCKAILQPQEKGKKETPIPREKVFVCIFYGRVGHLDEFCFRCKRIEKRRLDCARNSYLDEFLDFLPHSYSRASPRTFARALPQFSHGPNHRSYGFGSRESRFVPRRFGYIPHPHRPDRFPRRTSFSAGASHTHFEPRHLDGPHFPHRGSHPTGSSGEVLKTVKMSSSRMVKCWIPKIYLTNPSTEPSTSSRSM